MDTKITLTLVLKSVGNPDLGQYAPVSHVERLKVATAAEAREKARAYIDFWCLGGGNWAGGAGDLLDARGRVVARVWYNGRVVSAHPSTPELAREATAAEIVTAFEARGSQC